MKKEDCKTCGGCGIILVSCPTCKKNESITCPTCYGQGQVPEECPTCKGIGEKREKQQLNAKEIQIIFEMNFGLKRISDIYEKLNLKMYKENEAREIGQKLIDDGYILGVGIHCTFQNNGFFSNNFACTKFLDTGKEYLKEKGLIKNTSNT